MNEHDELCKVASTHPLLASKWRRVNGLACITIIHGLES